MKVEEGLAIKIEPHPRFYTDPTDTVPIAVPALLREWWPMMFFLVFKSPAEGRTHIFGANEPFAQFTVIPAESDFELVEGTADGPELSSLDRTRGFFLGLGSGAATDVAKKSRFWPSLRNMRYTPISGRAIGMLSEPRGALSEVTTPRKGHSLFP